MRIDLSGNALEVAPTLLTCCLCVRSESGEVSRHPITEVEAYHGFEDKASHAHRGKTIRNAVMFGPHGYWYVYLCYGVHWLLNLVTGPEGYPSAVLIRGVQNVDGPGRVTKQLGIGKQFVNMPCSVETGLWIEPLPRENELIQAPLQTSARIGVDYAGPEWAAKQWRFYRKGTTKIKPKANR